MRYFKLNICASLVLLLSSNVSSDNSMSSRLQIQIPINLYKPSGYEHQEALFGIPPYGGSIAQRLVYPIEDTTQSYQLCSDSEADSFVNPSPDQPFILLVDRGGTDCTFVSKVRRGQHLGASGVIIADDRCLCSDNSCKSEVPCQPVEPIMADDGSGSSITIPSFLMTKKDSDTIKTYIQAKQYIQAEMTWSLPSPDDRVEWSMWTSTVDPSSEIFKQEFSKAAVSFGKHAYFTPYYMIYDGTMYGCQSNTEICGNLCTNKGRYCFPDPDWDRDSGISGADVIEETLRQKCIWLHYGGDKAKSEDQGVGPKWWAYVNNFNTMCGLKKFADKTCIASAMSAALVDKALIETCITQSGGLTSDIDNSILSSELSEKSTKSIVVTPTIYVNNVVERGGITLAAVFNTICSGFAPGTQPKACQCAGQLTSSAVNLCIDNGGMPEVVRTGVSLLTVFTIIVAILVSVCIGGMVYYRKMQDDMREQVRGILAEYMPLEDMDSADKVPFIEENSNSRNGFPFYKPTVSSV